MNYLTLKIHDEKIMDKLLWMLEHFKSDGVEIKKEPISKNHQQKTNFSKEHIRENWREIGMNTHSSDVDDNDIKYEAYGVFHAEKYSS